MTTPYALLAELRRVERRAALATLVASSGKSPKKVGAAMWVGEGGRILGSVTIGGCVDARVIELAESVLASGEPVRHEMALDDDDAWAIGLACGGTIELYVEPVALHADDDPTVAAIGALRPALDAGDSAVVVTRLDATRARLVAADGLPDGGTLGDPALDAAAREIARAHLAAGTPGLHEVGDASLFALHLAPPTTLVIVGASDVAMALVALARPLGMRTVVVDGRERFATRERFPDADELLVGMPSALVERQRLGRATAVVLLAHDHKYDLPVLRHTLRSGAGYVGMLGSRRRGAAMRELLAEDGLEESALARLRTPVGLDIGARDAAEIALSIVAEVVAERRGAGQGGARRGRGDGV